MFCPPSLQARLANIRSMTVVEQDALDADIRRYLRNEVRVHGRIRPDAWPDLFPATDEPSL